MHHLVNLHPHLVLLLHYGKQFSQEWHTVGMLSCGEVQVRDVFLAFQGPAKYILLGQTAHLRRYLVRETPRRIARPRLLLKGFL